jgi:hypothetical protein
MVSQSEVSLHSSYSTKFHILVNLHSTKRVSISNYIGVFFWMSVYPILKEVFMIRLLISAGILPP